MLKIYCDIINDLWGSDHYPLIITYGGNVTRITEIPNTLNYKKANWELFKNCLKDDIRFKTQHNNVEEAYSNLILACTEASILSIPKRKSFINHKYSPFWTPKCSEAKKIKKEAEKNLRKTKNLNNQILFKKSKAQFKIILLKAKLDYCNNNITVSKQKPNTKIVWDIINKMKGKNTSTKYFFKDSSNNLINDNELSKLFASNFEKLSSDNNLSQETLNNRPLIIKSFLKNINNPNNDTDKTLREDVNIINEPFKISELVSVIKDSNINSAPGSDDIPFSYYKHAPDTVIKYILNFINLSWITNVIPISWKTSIVKPILKPNKDSSDINSYRPISITNTIIKLIEKIIVKRLNWYLEKNSLLNPNQAGFRKNFSTCDPIVRLNHEIDFSVSHGYHSIAILIDFTRAFDLIWVDGLLTKIYNLKITGNTYKFIKNFLTDRINIVKIGTSFSSLFALQNGTPQGSSLSPLLFLIMTNDFPKLSKFTSDALFADDCTIWRSGRNIDQIVHHLQEDLEVISKWVTKWGLSINVEKTTAIIFTKSKINVSNFKLKVGQSTIVIKNSCKLLGVVFDKQ